jgi:protein gp37
MGATTEIAWTDSTFNPWVGCQAVSPGCDHCYPEAHFAKRLKFVEWGPHG